jgi:hypothetical protein
MTEFSDKLNECLTHELTGADIAAISTFPYELFIFPLAFGLTDR